MGQAAGGEFSVRETHGILWRPENRVHARSDGRGWPWLYASAQREQPYEAEYDAVADHLVILHLDGPVGVSRTLGSASTRRVIPPGGLFIMPGGQDFRVRLEDGLDSLHVYLRHGLVAEVAGELGMGDPAKAELLPRIGVQDPLVENLALAVRETLDPAEPADRVYVEYLGRALAARLLRRYSAHGETAPEPGRGGLSRTELKRAVEVMEERLNEPLTLADIAEGAGLSPTAFARAFKTAVGAPPHQHLMRLRVERARRLLANTEAPIVEIALACGFSHQEHLTRVFRRATGFTPASYRRSVG